MESFDILLETEVSAKVAEISELKTKLAEAEAENARLTAAVAEAEEAAKGNNKFFGFKTK